MLHSGEVPNQNVHLTLLHAEERKIKATCLQEDAPLAPESSADGQSGGSRAVPERLQSDSRTTPERLQSGTRATIVRPPLLARPLSLPLLALVAAARRAVARSMAGKAVAHSAVVHLAACKAMARSAVNRRLADARHQTRGRGARH